MTCPPDRPDRPRPLSSRTQRGGEPRDVDVHPGGVHDRQTRDHEGAAAVDHSLRKGEPPTAAQTEALMRRLGQAAGAAD